MASDAIAFACAFIIFFAIGGLAGFAIGKLTAETSQYKDAIEVLDDSEQLLRDVMLHLQAHAALYPDQAKGGSGGSGENTDSL